MIKIITSDRMGDPYEDWSNVRSHGRAKRRRKMGHRQQIVIRYRANGKVYHDTINNTLIMHPDDRVRLEAALNT